MSMFDREFMAYIGIFFLFTGLCVDYIYYTGYYFYIPFINLIIYGQFLNKLEKLYLHHKKYGFN